MKFSWVFPVILLELVRSASFAAMEFKEAEITTIKNMVEHDPGSGAAPAKVNEKILEKSKVSTAAASMAELTFADTSITRMGANTQFSFSSKERLVKLDQGTVLIHTPPGNGGATVDCGGVTGAVSGTTFMASHDVSGNVMFVLLEGQGGLKVTAGGSTTIIRPGQAASVGAEVKKEISSQEGLGTPGGDKKSLPQGGAGGASTEEKGGSGQGPASSGAGEGGTPPAAAPKIQVFDVDVKKVVATTPLIVEFKNELPSTAKIDKTIEIQQTAVKEGKLEKLEVEVVAVKSKDGDLLVGAPRVEKEEMVVVNKKTEVIGRGGPGENLDIETAAGPGAGSGTGGGMAAAPAPRVETPTAPPSVTPPVNPGQTALQPPPAATTVAVTARVNDVSRPFGQDNPSFDFSLTSGSLLAGHSLVTDFLTAATRTSGVPGSPYAVNFSNPKIVDGSGADVSSRYNLTTLPGVLNVVKAGQSVTFGSVGSLTFGQSVDLVASALGGEVDFEVVSGSASVVNGKLVANSGTGTVQVRAVTAGNDNYSGADAVQTITLAKAGQSVSFALPSSLTFDTTTGLGATVTGAGSVSYELVNAADASKVSISGGQLKALSGTGTVQVRAVTAGNDNYSGADAVQTITLAKAAQILTFGSVTPRLTGSTTLLPVSGVQVGTPSFAVTETDGRATVDSLGNVTIGKILGAQTFQLTASAAGNDNYLSKDETITVNINPDTAAIRAANPIRAATDVAGAATKVIDALDAYFYYDRRAFGVTSGPGSFFAETSTPASINVFDPFLSATDLGIAWTALDRSNGDEFLFYAARKLEAHSSGGLNLTVPTSPTENIHKVFFGAAVQVGGTSGSFGNSPWTGTSGIYDPLAFGPPGSANSLVGSWDEWTGSGLTSGNLASVGDRWRTWNDEGGFLTNSDYLYLTASTAPGAGPTPSLTLVAGNDGAVATADLQAIGFSLSAAQARVELLSAGSARIESSWFTDLATDAGLSPNWSWSNPGVEDHTSFKLEAKQKVIMGASSSAAGTVASTTASRSTPVTDADAEDKQVRIEAYNTSSGSTMPTPESLAVVRSGDSLELRNVVIRGFAGAKLEGAAGRVLVSGTTMRDFKIKELAGLAVNTDAKIQMAAVDAGGNLAGKLQVAEGLPVDKQATGQMVSVAVDALNRRMEEIKLDANEVSLAADRIHIGADNLRTQISAQNLITLRANTVLMQNTFMTVMNNSGMINVYVRGVGGSLVNPTFGTMVADKLNFQGFNTFKIGSLTFDVVDQLSLDQARSTGKINEVTGPGSAPQAGRLNVLQM